MLRGAALGIALASLLAALTAMPAQSPELVDALSQAEQAARRHRSDDPGADEVIDAYRRVLALDDKNETARQALAEITIRYAHMIEDAEALERFDEAARLHDRIARRLADTAWRVGNMADHGNSSAQAAMGLMHRRGLLLQQSREGACPYYEKAAGRGEAAAAYHYALCQEGADRSRLDALLGRAAERGHATAQHLLGESYLAREPRDTEEAARWIREAADQGRPSAKSLLAWLYATGTGVPRDEHKAFELYTEAALAGVRSAQNNLAEMYERGGIVPQDYEQAARLYRVAAEAGFPPAEFNLGRLYAEGSGVVQDKEAAQTWLKRAQRDGVEQAAALLDWLDKQEESP